MFVERFDPEPQITIVTDEATATALCALLGAIGCPNGKHNKSISLFEVYQALEDALPNRTKSFSDFFAGDVAYRLPDNWGTD